MEDRDAYALGIAVGQLNKLLEGIDPEAYLCVTSNLFDDDYLSDEYDSGLTSVGCDPAEWETEEVPDHPRIESGEPQSDLFSGGPGHANNPTEDGVYLIPVSGTPGLYSRFVSTMGWSHPSAFRRDLDNPTLPFIGWPYWNWEEIE